METQNIATDKLFFEEVDANELNGNARDAITGFGIGLGAVAAVATITT
ncbi:hypothetical protein [Streptococcus chenjunshii]|nr:hypothetical protein [Streptococcus chenjunshii]